MENKNYTMTCLWVGEIKDENLKEVAKVMMWNCCPATYKDDEIIANAGLNMALDGEPHRLFVIIDGIHYNYDLTSKRVSAKMGKEIVELILKAVAEHKEDKEIMDIKIVYQDGFEYTDSVESTEPINPEDPWGHTEVDYVLPQANMAYVGHMGWVEDFDSLEKADEQVVELWVDGELIWNGR